jgi:RNA-directed DNA polymerase
MAIRTTTTRTTKPERSRSADDAAKPHAEFSLPELVTAYLDCRHSKRNTESALAWELDLEHNLIALDERLRDGTYRPGRSICFVVTRPKPREIWAAPFEDRIPHHLLYNKIGPRFERDFIADSCACIEGRGTLYAAKRLESKIRSATENWTKPVYYLKLDLANFFVSIDKNILFDLLAAKAYEPWWLWLTKQILFHDPRPDVLLHSSPELMQLIPAHKSLFNQPAHLGLPIGNLSSQFFANVYLNELDQFVKHRLGIRHYVRYVDDFVLLHENPTVLNEAHAQIARFLPLHLGARLNEAKTILQPVDRGVDFVGHVIKPHCRTMRKRTVNAALSRVESINATDLFATTNSYFGLLGQASHSHKDRATLARAVMKRGHAVDRDLTKCYRRSN